MKLTASMASSTPLAANLSRVKSKRGMLATGKRSLGLVQLSGRNLVPNPPAKIRAFNAFDVLRVGVRFCHTWTKALSSTEKTVRHAKKVK